MSPPTGFQSPWKIQSWCMECFFQSRIRSHGWPSCHGSPSFIAEKDAVRADANVDCLLTLMCWARWAMANVWLLAFSSRLCWMRRGRGSISTESLTNKLYRWHWFLDVFLEEVFKCWVSMNAVSTCLRTSPPGSNLTSSEAWRASVEWMPHARTC